MPKYIQGIGSIGAHAWQHRTPMHQFVVADKNPMPSCEPDYSSMIAPMQLRRMSKVVRMGIAASKMAMHDAGDIQPDIITLGTAYGCLADTEFFLQKLIRQEETMLTPTAFIQSTHNTVSGQIALMLSCHGHNFTFVHRGHSFEYALQDALMWLNESPEKNILMGAVDEFTQHSFQIMERMGTYKQTHENWHTPSTGTIAGEGANIFLLSNTLSENSYAEVVDLHLFSTGDITKHISEFLATHQLQLSDVDNCWVGLNGDTRYDSAVHAVQNVLSKANIYTYKNISGEFPTSSAFAMSLAAHHIKYGFNDESSICMRSIHSFKQYALIYHHYKQQYHSLILLKHI